MTEKNFIDVENVIRSKSENLYKLLPGFIIRYLKRIVHEDEINAAIARNKDVYGVEFAKHILEEFRVKIVIEGEEHILSSNRFLAVSNHPLGGLDGIALLHRIGQYKPIKAVINDLLMNVKNLSPLFIPVNKHGNNPKSYIKILNDAFDSEDNILYFPAGLVSRKEGKIIKDLEWKKSFLQKAVKSKRDIIPVYVSGRNTNFFYNLANLRKKLGIKANIEMLYLVDEMYRQKDAVIKIIYGKPIPYSVFDNSKDDSTWASLLREHCYRLALDKDAVFLNNPSI